MLYRTYTRRNKGNSQSQSEDFDSQESQESLFSFKPAPVHSHSDVLTDSRPDNIRLARSLSRPDSQDGELLMPPPGPKARLQKAAKERSRSPSKRKGKNGLSSQKSWSQDSQESGGAGSRFKQTVTAWGTAAPSTATLMEAQESGEMMEYVDEANFAMDGLRPSQPVRVMRASVATLAELCSFTERRRLFRAHGLAKTMLDQVVLLPMEDQALSLAATALVYFLSVDDHADCSFLESVDCVRFLLEILHSPSPSPSLDRASQAVETKIRSLFKKVKEVPEGDVTPQWLALLALEHACTSAVVLETETLEGRKETFKKLLKQEGGLDAVSQVAAKCLDEMGKESKVELQELASNLGMLLRCLRVVEHVTFMSPENQLHLLELKMKAASEKKKAKGLSFVRVVVSCVARLADLSKVASGAARAAFSQTSSASTQHAKQSHKSAELSALKVPASSSREPTPSPARSPKLAAALATSLRTVGTSLHNVLGKADQTDSACTSKEQLEKPRNKKGKKTESDSTGQENKKGKKQVGKPSVNGPKVADLTTLSVFEFDEVEEIIAPKREGGPLSVPATKKQKDESSFEFEVEEISQSEASTADREKIEKPQEDVVDRQHQILLNDCLVAAVKVLMNLTNENPLGCCQVAACQGLDIITSLLIAHCPSPQPTNHKSPPSGKPEAKPEEERKAKLSESEILERVLSQQEKLKGSGEDLDLLVVVLGVLVNLVEEDHCNRTRLAFLDFDCNGRSYGTIPFLCALFRSKQGAGERAEQAGNNISAAFEMDDELKVAEGQREAEDMIVEAYAALLLAFLAQDSPTAREALAAYLPGGDLKLLAPVLERFLDFHKQMKTMTEASHARMMGLIALCKGQEDVLPNANDIQC